MLDSVTSLFSAIGAGLVSLGALAKKDQRVLRLADRKQAYIQTARHAVKMNRIAGQLKTRRSTKPLRFHKKSVSHQVPRAVDNKFWDDQINVADLNEIISIDPEKRICVAEPGVTFVDLVRATLPFGLAPIIVPELKEITIGGAVSGCSIESMSFRYGGFHDTCLEYEVLTANGEVLTCSPESENELLFQMLHGTFGTLGLISKLTFRLIPAKPFVKLTYEKHRTLESYKDSIWRHYQEQDVQFMDGIIHSSTEYVLSVGDFVDEAPYTNRYDWMKVYYKSTSTRREDYLRTADYYFRYDRGVTNVHPKSAIGRLLFGKFMDSSTLLRLAEKFHWVLSKERPDVILDVFLPFSKVTEFLTWYEKEFNFFPLWCVPYKLTRPYEWLSAAYASQVKDELFVDLAIYGMKQRDGKNYYKIMEDKLMELGAIKTLISHNYYEREAFWKTWNQENFSKVKALTDPNNIFRDLYDKTCRREAA